MIEKLSTDAGRCVFDEVWMSMKKTVIAICFGVFSSMAILPLAKATLIEFETTSLGGNNYRHTYTVTNDTLGAPLQLFDIEFDPTLYLESSLSIVTPAALQTEWDEVFFPSDPILPLSALYDVFALSGGLAAGTTASGFAVEFQWLGGGLPGSQLFQVYDYDMTSGLTTLLETGLTRSILQPPPNPVDEPGTFWVLMLGAMALYTARMKRAARSA